MSSIQINIAIIEDEVYFIRLLTKYIQSISEEEQYENFDFHIKSYKSAHDFLSLMNPDLDVVFLDYYLDTNNNPEVLNAEDVIGRITRACDACEIFLISQLDDEETVNELIKAGVKAYISKRKISPKQIQNLIKESVLNKNYQNHKRGA